MAARGRSNLSVACIVMFVAFALSMLYVAYFGPVGEAGS